MMTRTQAAMYARVSSERQAEAHTVESQVAARRERIAQEGLHLPDEWQFIDEGIVERRCASSAERLRDAWLGAVDRLYVHSPDRLARQYAYQGLLVDEFQRAGVEVVFLNRELGHTPEDELLLQVQGLMAEYERAKILERHRRGKRHAAPAGSSAPRAAPYGYRYSQAPRWSARYEMRRKKRRSCARGSTGSATSA
jgi:site-specific DNA recombinase